MAQLSAMHFILIKNAIWFHSVKYVVALFSKMYTKKGQKTCYFELNVDVLQIFVYDFSRLFFILHLVFKFLTQLHFPQLFFFGFEIVLNHFYASKWSILYLHKRDKVKL